MTPDLTPEPEVLAFPSGTMLFCFDLIIYSFIHLSPHDWLALPAVPLPSATVSVCLGQLTLSGFLCIPPSSESLPKHKDPELELLQGLA